MGNINPEYNDRVRYTLYSDSLGSLVITEPIGWNSDEKELARNKTYHGFVSTFSNSSKYVGDAKDYIQTLYDIDGIQCKILLKREEKHPHTDEWTLSYSGYLDLSTWESENNQIGLKFNSGGLEQELKARESELVEIDRLTTMDGKAIPPLQPISVALDGRRIFLKTSYGVNTIENKVKLSNFSNGFTRGRTAPVPITIVNKSHESAQSPIYITSVNDNSWDRDGNGENGLLFFAISDRDRILNVKFKFDFTLNITRWDDVNSYRFWTRLVTYQNNENYEFKENRILFTDNNYTRLNGKTFSITFEETITVLKGESLGLVFDQNADLGNNITRRGHVDTELTLNNVVYMNIEEDSFFEKSTTKAILVHELLDRVVTIATNKENVLYSEYFGRTDLGYATDGPGSLTAITHGFWVRGFDKLPIPVLATATTSEIKNLFKPLTTSVKETLESLDAVWNIGMEIERKGNKERVRVENLSYFYNNNVTIRLSNQVNNVKRFVATEYYYSALEFGSEKGGDYEEAMGLDEYNTKSSFTTVITRVTGLFSKISKFRLDMYGMEFARRKPKSLNDTEDTPYDTDKFMLDLKRGASAIFEQRKWQDDLSKEPTGVFSPETATNLRFSPFNCLLRHSWWFGGGFKKYITEYVRYGSSTANSQLKTQLIGGLEYAENGNIINNELQKARMFPEWIEFEYECDFFVMQMVEGSTLILGKKVPNYYGLVEFINENGFKEKGFLFNLKPNGKGQWKLLKANR